MSLIRLDKFLAEMQIGTRSEVKKLIRGGKVQIDGHVCKNADEKIDPEQAEVMVDHVLVGYAAYEYFMLNKPKGCVSATEDSRYPTVLDYITDHKRKDLFPVGRLDLDTEGLLLITNDGALAHELLSPAKHIPKTYEAKIDGIVTQEDVEIFAQGMDIGEKKPTKPAELLILKANVISHVQVTIYEGKFHQIKRMFESVGKPVLELKRISMGALSLDEKLAPGEYRALTDAEINYLRQRG
ncbi:MAG: rRNA pseudouridine synthase [Lachnospiraceae bacterium]|nr:rRNA pseudouridine synthase [Lachnospiraceae bacterium]